MKLIDTLTPRRKAIILVSCCLSLLIVSMDATIVNVAIPSIRTDLHASASQLQWVVDVYTLVLASLLMLSGATGDRFGRRRIFQIGLVVFAVGSLMCSLAPNIETLILARLLQAVGGSMLNPVALSIISQVFTERVERARALGFWGAVVGISMALGPVVGGFLIELISWRAVFWINLPICAAAVVLTAIFVPETQVEDHARTSTRSARALAVTFLFGVVFTLIEGPGYGLEQPPRHRGGGGRADRLRGVPAVRGQAPRPVHRPTLLPQHPLRRCHGHRDLRLLGVGRVPVHDVAVPAVRARLLGDAHGPDLRPDRHWRAGVLADLRPHGRPLRRQAVAAGGRHPDHHRVGAADVPDQATPRCGGCW